MSEECDFVKREPIRESDPALGTRVAVRSEPLTLRLALLPRPPTGLGGDSAAGCRTLLPRCTGRRGPMWVVAHKPYQGRGCPMVVIRSLRRAGELGGGPCPEVYEMGSSRKREPESPVSRLAQERSRLFAIATDRQPFSQTQPSRRTSPYAGLQSDALTATPKVGGPSPSRT
jgi:hypothetical protein